MKSLNPGHELDNMGGKLKNIEAIYIYGADAYARSIRERLLFPGLDAHFLCKRFLYPRKLWEEMLICKRYALNKNYLYRTNSGEGGTITRDSVVDILKNPHNLLIVPDENRSVMAWFARTRGENGCHVFTATEFFNKYLPVLALYSLNKVYFPSISFIPSTKCNLNCRHCLNFTPHITNFRDEPIEKLKAEIDLFFSVVDYIDLFHISGGEPFLYPHLPELVAYLGKYRSRINKLAVTTNGTVKVPARLIGALQNSQATLICDDYTASLPKYKAVFKQLLSDIKGARIDFIVNRARAWINLLGNPARKNEEQAGELEAKFMKCGVPWQEYADGKLYICNYAHYAEKAGLNFCSFDEYLDLKNLDDNYKKEIVEFRLGYSKKGYTEFCRKCAGYFNNPFYEKPALQMERKGNGH